MKKKKKKKMKIYGFQFFPKTLRKTTDGQVLKNSTLHHKISRRVVGGLLQIPSAKSSSNIPYTITQRHCC